MSTRKHWNHIFRLILSICLVLNWTTTINAQSVEQPIQFNHKTHALDYAVSCQFCHYYAERTDYAGIPSLMDCLGCHQLVKGTDETKKAEIKKLDDFWLLKKSLVWIRLNDLPDFVYFSHSSHTRAGYSCEKCHGEVTAAEDQSQAGKISDLTMGWCVSCHREKQPVDRNGLIINDPSLLTNKADNARASLQGSLECQSCHK